METLIGHTRQVTHFCDALRTGTAGHAYLVTGPEGIGKRTAILEAISRAHGGLHAGSTDPHTILVGVPTGSISIEQVRAIRTAVILRPPQGVRVCVVLDDAERMTGEAAHAFLKVLEEPPSYVTFFLITALPGRLLETIRSRCSEVRFVPPSVAMVRSFLSERGVAQKEAYALAAVSGGSIGWATRILDAGAVDTASRDAYALDTHLHTGIAERMILAKKLATDDDIRSRVLRWVHAYRASLSTESDAALGHDLLALYERLGRSAYTTRLVLEEFLLARERTA